MVIITNGLNLIFKTGKIELLLRMLALSGHLLNLVFLKGPPLLFILYINDICDGLVSDSLLFADDMKIYHIINNEADSLILQSDIDMIVSWSNTWLMSLNPVKCKVLTVSLKRNFLKHSYTLGVHDLQKVNCMRDLGVIIDQKLNCCDHVSIIIQGARKALGFKGFMIELKEYSTSFYFFFINVLLVYIAMISIF